MNYFRVRSATRRVRVHHAAPFAIAADSAAAVHVARMAAVTRADVARTAVTIAV